MTEKSEKLPHQHGYCCFICCYVFASNSNVNILSLQFTAQQFSCARNISVLKSTLRQQYATSLKQLVIPISSKCTNVVSHTYIPCDTKLLTTANIQARFSMPFRFHLLFLLVTLLSSAHNDRKARCCHLLVLFTTTTTVDCCEHP